MIRSAFLHLSDVRFSYRTAADGWSIHIPSLSIRAGDVVIITGDNMSGKSTLLRLLAGLTVWPQHAGVIGGNGELFTGIAELASRSVVLSSDDDLFPDLTVADNVWLALDQAARRSNVIDRITALMKSLSMQESIDPAALAGDLSSGGRALIKLSRALLSSQPVIIVDEVTGFLDDVRARAFLDVLLDERARGRAIVLVSHSERDRAYLRDKGAARTVSVTRASPQLSEVIEKDAA